MHRKAVQRIAKRLVNAGPLCDGSFDFDDVGTLIQGRPNSSIGFEPHDLSQERSKVSVKNELREHEHHWPCVLGGGIDFASQRTRDCDGVVGLCGKFTG